MKNLIWFLKEIFSSLHQLNQTEKIFKKNFFVLFPFNKKLFSLNSVKEKNRSLKLIMKKDFLPLATHPKYDIEIPFNLYNKLLLHGKGVYKCK